MRIPDGPRGILCSGSIVYDTLARAVETPRWGATTFIETIESHVGGNGANTALALATIGVPVRLLGAVGNDEQGRFLLQTLAAAGVDASGVIRVGPSTAASVILVNGSGDRAILHRPGASALAFTEPLTFPHPVTAGISHYHLASMFVLPHFRHHAPETLRRARAAGLTTSVDTNWDPQGRWLLDLEPCLPELDFLFLNEDEARMITGTSDPAGGAAKLRSLGARNVVVKLGARGCAIYTANVAMLLPAYEIDAKDTTGAGDCFVAGFLAALCSGVSLEAACRFANAAGALSAQRVGGAAGILPLDQIQAWMQTATCVSKRA